MSKEKNGPTALVQALRLMREEKVGEVIITAIMKAAFRAGGEYRNLARMYKFGDIPPAFVQFIPDNPSLPIHEMKRIADALVQQRGERFFVRGFEELLDPLPDKERPIGMPDTYDIGGIKNAWVDSGQGMKKVFGEQEGEADDDLAEAYAVINRIINEPDSRLSATDDPQPEYKPARKGRKKKADADQG